MQVELSILKHLLNKEHFNKYSSFINVKDFADDEELAWNCFLQVIGMEDVTINKLKFMGFISA